ncbi:hypothetical protein BABINDRAFT_169912 [Babjeviella inositovora NRRL Y-12698]|uniref:Methyltransferase type 11 domain-containing protein n=1 Tax=Babjeviella inositovora NRRL Y-12698 TaxID=984486 RepID=A0A1E3QYU7_9ASCO|nr:uncharacterized protein BABINDRAFT_169912 [Babjeviella inositovora NRRL Y-12698]ODQ82724.1 hypothetical protein BABINDRAFT_169912 [Babjeviella inositovora NRRL Y-12698]
MVSSIISSLDLTEYFLPSSVTAASSYFLAVVLLSTFCYINQTAKSAAIFAYNCFIKPFTRTESPDQQEQLEHFYKSQAGVYDKTRKLLLKGRENALKLGMSHLLSSHPTQKKLVWVDVGGGTGWNIEYMNSVLRTTKQNFAKIYLVDLSPSLCEVARSRLALQVSHGVVEVVCGDASSFNLELGLAENSVDFITFSYSLSMIPTYFSAIDHVIPLLNKNHGVVTVADFGVQSTSTSVGRINTLGGLVGRNNSWVPRNFWRIWFEFDNVHLDSSRRNYLEYKFGTLKSINSVNSTLGNIPYYTWVGCDKLKCANLVNKINAHVTESPYLLPAEIVQHHIPVSKGHEAVVDNLSRGLPFPSMYYQKQVWRVFYNELNPLFAQFNNQYIYAFTWEDPREDHKILNINNKDSLLAITSAGDNLLHYACLPSPPRRIHGVDLNPAQNHLLELKLACFKSGLKQDQIWSIFGEGKLADFHDVLLQKLAPYLSSNALQFWADKGSDTFAVNGHGLYYDTGSTRWALKLANWIFIKAGITKDVEKLCNCTTIEEQKRVWETKVKPAIFSPIVGKLIVANSVFLWKALGVPANQANMINGSILDYIVDTLDPIVTRSLISTDNYFYYLCLMSRYARDNCPDYLTDAGYKKLSALENSPLETIRLHTDTLNEVLARVTAGSFTIIVIMDHMDWFDTNGWDAREEVELLYRALADGGRVMLRSASTHPWYIDVFEKNGFHCEAAAVRLPGESIDRCNMYTSTWVATKISHQRKMSKLTI